MYPSRRRNPSPHRPPELVKKQGVEIERLREAANKFETELLQVKEEKATQQKHLEELEATLAKVEAEYAQEIDDAELVSIAQKGVVNELQSKNDMLQTELAGFQCLQSNRECLRRTAVLMRVYNEFDLDRSGNVTKEDLAGVDAILQPQIERQIEGRLSQRLNGEREFTEGNNAFLRSIGTNANGERLVW